MLSSADGHAAVGGELDFVLLNDPWLPSLISKAHGTEDRYRDPKAAFPQLFVFSLRKLGHSISGHA